MIVMDGVKILKVMMKHFVQVHLNIVIKIWMIWKVSLYLTWAMLTTMGVEFCIFYSKYG